MESDIDILNRGMNTFLDWLDAKESDDQAALAEAYSSMKRFLGCDGLEIPADDLPKMVLKRCGYLEAD